MVHNDACRTGGIGEHSLLNSADFPSILQRRTSPAKRLSKSLLDFCSVSVFYSLSEAKWPSQHFVAQVSNSVYLPHNTYFLSCFNFHDYFILF